MSLDFYQRRTSSWNVFGKDQKCTIFSLLCRKSNHFFSQGYLFISVLVNTNSDLIKLIIQSIKNDLQSRNPVHVNLALQCIANIGSRDMAEAFTNEIPKLLVSGLVKLVGNRLYFVEFI